MVGVKRRIALITSGGDASGMNAAVRAVTRYAIYNDLEVYRFYEGFKGLINNNFEVLTLNKVSGIIAVNTGIACGADYILIPEIEVDLAKVANKIKNHRESKRHILVIVAEGAAKASEVASSIKLLVGHEVRISVLGHIQRGGSPSAMDRILAAEFGKKSVDLLLGGKSDYMVGIKSMKIEVSKFEDIFENKKEIDKELYKLAHILAS
jgi:6-phosphofructokinase 1